MYFLLYIQYSAHLFIQGEPNGQHRQTARRTDCRGPAYGKVYSRSTPKQIEYWFKIGKIAEENPDLPYNFIKQILLAKEEQTVPFVFDED